jgi:hypothetical protein
MPSWIATPVPETMTKGKPAIAGDGSPPNEAIPRLYADLLNEASTSNARI